MRFKYGKWYARWIEDGRQRMKAFPTRAEAKAFQQNIKRELKDQKKTPSLSPVSKLTIAWMQMHTHPNDYRAAQALIGLAGTMRVRELNFAVPRLVVENWRNKNLSPHTLYNYRYGLRRLLKYLVANGAPQEVLIELPRVAIPDYRDITLNEEEHLALLNHCRPPKFEPWFRCFLLSCLYLGLRRSEALRLAPVHYDPAIKEFNSLRVKGNRRQNLHVPGELQQIFESIEVEGGQEQISFVHLLNGKSVSQHQICGRWKKLKQIAGIRPNVRVHDLRRTGATFISEDPEGGLLAAQQFLHHKDLGNTQAYLSFRRPEALKRVQERFANPHKMLPFPAQKKGAG